MLTEEEKRERKRLSQKKYRDSHKEEIREASKIYLKKNLVKVNKTTRDWQKKNKERFVTYHKEYEIKNKEKRKAQKAKKYEEDPLTKLRVISGARTRSAFKAIGQTKNKTSERLLGCPLKEAIFHLEEQFQSEMSWSNMGNNGWHIDHIIPMSYADTKEDLEQLCLVQNLRPLWEGENLSKGATMPETMFYL